MDRDSLEAWKAAQLSITPHAVRSPAAESDRAEDLRPYPFRRRRARHGRRADPQALEPARQVVADAKLYRADVPGPAIDQRGDADAPGILRLPRMVGR
jgi:hypothetical protein